MNARYACCALLLPALLLAGCRDAPALGDSGAAIRTLTVDVLAPRREAIERTSTQPATVHAFYEAHLHAKVSGYVDQLEVDIGQQVAAGEVLATLSVPETAKQREAKDAEISRLKAEELRSAANVTVASAAIQSSAAMVDKAQAEVKKAQAHLAAAGVEKQRVTELVSEEAVADRLLDEATKKFEAAEAEVTAAEAGVTAAEAGLELSKAKLDAANADVKVAQSLTDVAHRELEELDEYIKYAQVKAPFAGVVTARNIDEGDLVRNAQTGDQKNSKPLFIVAQIDKVRVRTPLPERDAPLANVGDTASIHFQALPSEKFTGQISRIAKALDPNTRTMLVEIDLDNRDGKLLPGMFGQATVILEETAEQILLPANAVRYDEHGRSTVYVVDDGNKVQVVEVATGWDNGEEIQIVSGLTGDERIIGPSLHRFQPGQSVQVR